MNPNPIIGTALAVNKIFSWDMEGGLRAFTAVSAIFSCSMDSGGVDCSVLAEEWSGFCCFFGAIVLVVDLLLVEDRRKEVLGAVVRDMARLNTREPILLLLRRPCTARAFLESE